ncbi:hypothetical protein RND81_12G020200 [Saponaria officinalis]|uniref:ATP-dependent DNA helicase n=1 Tax=Saponaria officinalis TaxID=3572 RepID=A0AAW1H279_SAPOF
MFCSKCGAKKFEYEVKGLCCCDGEVRLASSEFSEELIRLFTARDEESIHFQTYSRLYNNLFAFTSLGGTFDAKNEKGIYVFKAHGHVYHNLPNLIPMDSIPQYLQQYFYDAQHEKNNRLRLFPNLKEEIITLLMGLMNDNPYEITKDTRILLSSDPGHDQRVYNAPTSDEVAAVWLENTAHQGNEGPHIYPLLLPKGDNGWHQGLKKVSSPTLEAATSSSFPLTSTSNGEPETLIEAEINNAARRYTRADKQISCREYYVYKLQIRPGNILLRGGRLFQQYIIDMYVKIENTRLDFLRLNQDTIRADLYQGILDTIELGEKSVFNVGRRVVLSPSFLGGPRDKRRRYLNAMALVQKYGKPDLFLTITCNPNWIKIKSELCPGEQAQNRPDLVARIFNAKLTALRKEIMAKKIFGEVAAMINVVEFQKRGLPHAHFLIILKPNYKIISLESFDKYVCAELPSEENPHLRAAVIRHMMHGPCGRAFPNCPCMRIKDRQRICKSGYPKKNNEFTTNGSDCYPLYRRRATKETVVVRKVKMDNRSAIPYNPYLLAVFDSHMNVEVCSTIKAVKYLYKYVYKGHDRILFNVANGSVTPFLDEIDAYQSGRWVSPPEVAWRIFGFNLFDIYPPVQALSVHTPNSQVVRFASHETLARIAADEHRSRTMLTEFFRDNSQPIASPRYLYSEFPEHFVWNEKRKFWKPRKRGIVIGRVAHAAPGEGERHTSFEDLLTVDDVRCTSFQEAALRRGILEADNAADHCMDEAVCPNNPSDFWDKYYLALSEDFRRQFPHDEQKILQLTSAQDSTIRSTRDITDALSTLAIMHHVKTGKPGAFFIYGPGGTGKTFLYGALYAKVRSMGKICLPTATSGIAASNLPTGRTAHSRFKIPLNSDESLTCNVPKQGGLPCLLREASLIIWDEASMAKKENIDAVDLLFQDIVVFGGDFRQVLPVLPRKTQQEAVDASIFSLTENHGLVKLPEQVILHYNVNQQLLQLLIDAVYPEVRHVTFTPDIFTERAILTPRNNDVDAINRLLIDKFPGESYSYKSFDSVIDDNSNVYPAENLDPAAGLCNGTRLICKHFSPNMIECEISTGYYTGERVFLPRITLKQAHNSKFPINFQRKQFPIKLSFVMTINKAQGQTLQKAGVYLHKPCFSG